MSEPSLEQRLFWRQRPTNQQHVMYQTWQHLLFLHWEVEPELIQSTLPKGLTVDTFEGRAYIGIVPFFMLNIRPRFLPAVPGISHFMETNVRTYVYDERGVPGVWFYSLDANQWLAVKVARTFFKLPYFHATMESPYINNWGLTKSPPKKVAYTVHRQGTDPQMRSHFRYRSAGNEHTAEIGSLEFFLLERYILFAEPNEGKLATGQVYHTPYPVHDAYVADWDNHLLHLDSFAIAPERPPDNILFSPGVTVDIFPLRKIDR